MEDLKMGKLIILVLILTGFNCYSQTQRDFLIVNENDTIFGKAVVPLLPVNKLDLSLPSKQATLKVADGREIRFTPHQIKQLTFYGQNQQEYKFVCLENEPYWFFHEIIRDKLSLYKYYYLTYYFTVLNEVSVFVKDGKVIYSNKLNARKNLAKLLNDCPEIQQELLEGKKYSFKEPEILVRDYNAHFHK